MTTQEGRLDAVVAEAVAGNRDALREVLETIRPIVIRYCRARVGAIDRSGLSADDVAQEVCLAAVMALPRYCDRGRPFLAFVKETAAQRLHFGGRNAFVLGWQVRTRSLGVAADQQLADTAAQRTRVDGFGDVAVATRVEGLQAVRFLSSGGKKNHGCFAQSFVLPDLPAQIEAADSG